MSVENLLVTDIGYGDTKFCWVENGELQLRKFPTAIVRKGRATPYPELEIEADSRELVFNGMRYLVGREAFLAGIPIPTRRKSFIPNYAPLLVAKMMREAGRKFEEIILSVAISDYNREHVEALKRSLSKFQVSGEFYQFRKILVLPQGYGIYRDVFPKKTEEPVIVVDVGYNTIDVSAYEGGKPVREHFVGLPGYGTNRIISNLLDRVRREINDQITELELNEAIQRGGKLRFYGKEYDISDLIDEEKEYYTEEVVSQLESSPFWRRAAHRIVAGGGGHFISDEIKKELNLIVPPSPEFSNVRGFLTAAREG